MVFSSITFLYYFLPIVLFIYYLVPKKIRNSILLLSSLAFYFYGENKYILILILSCITNYISALIIEKNKNKITSKITLIIAIIFNLGLLCYFKYTNFFIDNINNIFNSNINYIKVIMPIGISFFTFQTLSYVIDVYNGKLTSTKNIIDFSCYVCLFPQLIAGPIVRYSDVYKELKERKETFDNFGNGVERFIIGLSKKVLIANVVGELINNLNNLPNKSVVAYILIAISFTIQIYFDFSGYSDMAIGLGKMFGFNFKENFNYPLFSKTITDFWRRWHMSLSSFFKDYVYIPLGGNKKGKLKQIRNIFIVWMLTGFWHGAAWNFIIWGLYFGIILIIEKFFLKNFLDKHPVIGHFYTIFLVIISFIIFNADSYNYIVTFLKCMFGLNKLPFINFETIYYLKSYLIILVIAIISSTPLLKTIFEKLQNKYSKSIIFNLVEIIICFILLIIATSYLIDSSFNPFLYFRF